MSLSTLSRLLAHHFLREKPAVGLHNYNSPCVYIGLSMVILVTRTHASVYFAYALVVVHWGCRIAWTMLRILREVPGIEMDQFNMVLLS